MEGRHLSDAFKGAVENGLASMLNAWKDVKEKDAKQQLTLVLFSTNGDKGKKFDVEPRKRFCQIGKRTANNANDVYVAIAETFKQLL